MDNGKRGLVIWIIIVFILIAGGYALGFFFYTDYKEDLDKYTHFTIEKFEEAKNDLKGLTTIFENARDKNEIEKEKLLSEIARIKEEAQNLKNEYKASLSELKRTIEDLGIDTLTRKVENLQDNVDGFKLTLQDLKLKEEAMSVDLGKISVGEEKKREQEKKNRN